MHWFRNSKVNKYKAGSAILTSKSLRLFISPSASPPTHTCFPSNEDPFPPPVPTHSATLLSRFSLLTTSVSSSPQQKLTPSGSRPKNFMELAGENIARQSRRRSILLPAATIMRNPADPPKESWKVGGWEESGWGPNSAGFYQPRLNRSHCPGDSGTPFAKKLYFKSEHFYI